MSQLARTTSASTPVTPNGAASTPRTPSAQRPHEATPGSWRHPKFDEITRRQNATIFDGRNVQKIVMHVIGLALTVVVPRVIRQMPVLQALVYVVLSVPLRFIADICNSRPMLQTLPWTEWLLSVLRCVLLLNIVAAFMPLVRRRYYPDNIADIPLTPSQRQIMGLNPDVSYPQTPGTGYASPNYVTPPRYQKSTPRSSFSNSNDFGSQSPYSGSPRASMAKSTSNSPFSPSTSSPLFQKAVNGGSAKRLSYGGSPISSSFFGESSSGATPGAPTTSTGKASVSLNNKWLYEKRRDSPRSGLFN